MLYPRSRTTQPRGDNASMTAIYERYCTMHLRGGGAGASLPDPSTGAAAGQAPAHAAIPFLAALDDSLEAALASGAIFLIYADALRDPAAEAEFTTMPRRQDLEALQAERGKKIFLTPEEAVAALRANDRRIGALTYGWATVDNPDPTGTYLNNVRRFLRCPLGAHIVAVFWDYASLHQKPRTSAQDAFFSQALGVMGDVYASALATTVMRHRALPPRPAALDGELVVLIDAAAKGGALDDEAAVRAALGVHGAIESVRREAERWRVRFASHAHA